jgi:hypothetical protein
MARAVILRAFERQFWKINLRELYRCERRMAPTRRRDFGVFNTHFPVLHQKPL